MIELREITDANRAAVCALRVSPGQEKFVAPVSRSLLDARENPDACPWFRALYALDEPVGFVMLSWDVPPGRPGIIGPWFLWRLLIDERHQRKGYGRAAMAAVVALIRSHGATALLTSYQPGEGEPWPFYRSLGFVPTGAVDGTEIVLKLDIA